MISADDDVVGLLQQGDALGRHLAENAHRQTGAGKRLAAENVFRHAHVAADAADLIFEEIAQRLDELELHQFGQAAHVVVALDGLAGPFHAARLDHVGIKRALHQPVHAAGLLSAMRVASSSNTAMNSAPMILRFVSGSVTPASFAKKPLAGVDGDNVQAELVAQILLHAWRIRFCAARRC